jgi:antirestriction protein ArdC
VHQGGNENAASEAKKSASKVDQHRKEFVDKIIVLMEQGEIFWQKPWKIGKILPVNAVSRKNYQGCNIVYLLYAGCQRGYNDPRWLTFKQAQANKWQVKKGEKGTRVEFWSQIKDDGFDEAEPFDEAPKKENRPRLYCKIYTVFNAEQVDGIPPLEKNEEGKKIFALHERSERIMGNCGVPILYGGISAYYRPYEDKIYLPLREHFLDETHFYATAMHEIAHSTGHANRMNRKLCVNKYDAEYAREELRAEMASAFLQMELGFPLTEEGMREHTKTHAAYIQSWLEYFKKDYKEFYRATQDAVKIADYVLDYEKELTQNRENRRSAGPEAEACASLRREVIVRKKKCEGR